LRGSPPATRTFPQLVNIEQIGLIYIGYDLALSHFRLCGVLQGTGEEIPMTGPSRCGLRLLLLRSNDLALHKEEFQ
jgi:hypothetical protein